MAPKPQNETMHDGLKKILGDIAQISILPDADLQFVQQLQEMVVGKLREAATAGVTPGGEHQPGPGAGTPPGGPPGLGAPPGGPGAGSPLTGLLGGAGGPPPASGAPPEGMMTGGAMPGLGPGGPGGGPNMDELIRMLQSGKNAA